VPRPPLRGQISQSDQDPRDMPPLWPRARRGWLVPLFLVVACLAPSGVREAATAEPLGTTSQIAAVVNFPSTAAGGQAEWLFAAVLHHPIPASQVTAHFDAAYLATLPAPAVTALNDSFADIKSLSLYSITTSTPVSIAFVVTANGATRILVSLSVDNQGLISSLDLQAASPTPGSAQPSVPGARQIAVGVGSPPLKGALTLPDGKGPFPAVVLVSGSGPNDQNETIGPNHPFLDIALGLAAQGIATLRYDKRTLDYPASIDPATFTPTQEYVPDALAAIKLLEHEPAVNPHLIFVLGHSQGGTYAPLIAQRAPNVAGVILLAPGAEPLGQTLLRQGRYLATLPGAVGAAAKDELPTLTQVAAEISNVSGLESDNPSTPLFDGAGPAYFLSSLQYNEVATARSIPQPLLLLQGNRDYQVTVANDLDVWLAGLKGRSGVAVEQFPDADHLFLDGTGQSTPVEYAKPGHVDPAVIATIVKWVEYVATLSAPPHHQWLNLAYATRSPLEKLDIYVPTGPALPGLVVYVHGGAFIEGDKGSANTRQIVNYLLNQGFAVAAVNYRLAPKWVFPAPVQDVRAAVRWLRANATRYGYNPSGIAAAGDSSGGTLVALLATSQGVAALDDPTLGNATVSSSIRAAIVLYPDVNFLSEDNWLAENPACTGKFSNPNLPNSPASIFLGGPVQSVPNQAKAADPITYITPGKLLPKFLIAHGSDDCTVPYQGSVALYNAIVKAAGPRAAQLMIIKGAGHDGDFDSTTVLPVAVQLLRNTIGG
jgi:uncharacterized protein